MPVKKKKGIPFAGSNKKSGATTAKHKRAFAVAMFERPYAMGDAYVRVTGSKCCKSSACTSAMRWVLDPIVIKELERLVQEREDRTTISIDKIICELANIAYTDVSDFVSWGHDMVQESREEIIDPETGNKIITIVQTLLPRVIWKDSNELSAFQRRAVQEVQVNKDGDMKLKLVSKGVAFEQLGKHMGHFIQKHQIIGEDGKVIDPTNTEVVKEEVMNMLTAYVNAKGKGVSKMPADVAKSVNLH